MLLSLCQYIVIFQIVMIRLIIETVTYKIVHFISVYDERSHILEFFMASINFKLYYVCHASLIPSIIPCFIITSGTTAGFPHIYSLNYFYYLFFRLFLHSLSLFVSSYFVALFLSNLCLSSIAAF